MLTITSHIVTKTWLQYTTQGSWTLKKWDVIQYISQIRSDMDKNSLQAAANLFMNISTDRHTYIKESSKNIMLQTLATHIWFKWRIEREVKQLLRNTPEKSIKWIYERRWLWSKPYLLDIHHWKFCHLFASPSNISAWKSFAWHTIRYFLQYVLDTTERPTLEQAYWFSYKAFDTAFIAKLKEHWVILNELVRKFEHVILKDYDKRQCYKRLYGSMMWLFPKMYTMGPWRKRLVFRYMMIKYFRHDPWKEWRGIAS